MLVVLEYFNRLGLINFVVIHLSPDMWLIVVGVNQ